MAPLVNFILQSIMREAEPVIRPSMLHSVMSQPEPVAARLGAEDERERSLT
jgi:hypothetical protein